MRTFADWQDPPPGYLEGDLVARCGESAEGSFVQTLVLTDIAIGWTECLPLVAREGAPVIDVPKRARTLFPFPLKGGDFDNDTMFMNEAVVGWCRKVGLEITRSRVYRKNDQTWVEQKNGAAVRRLVGYARFEGLAATAELARLYAAARWHRNVFQASFKLEEKAREGARVRERYHAPVAPRARVPAHPAVDPAAK
ncbi:ISNCY family transposase, partial [Geminicoccaceae bacterium SYSU G07066]